MRQTQMPHDVTTLDAAIRDHRMVFHAAVSEITRFAGHDVDYANFPPLRKALVALYDLIDLLVIGKELCERDPSIELLGDLEPDDFPATIALLSYFANVFAQRANTNRDELLQERARQARYHA